MATVVLSTVGAIVGGPIGGAIGAIVGQQIDQAIFGGGKTREGPRLKELDVQTSSYGTQIPAIFGAMRVAGTVIWSTDLIERRKKSGGGKNRPSSVEYSYSASFAVALSSRPVARVGRIWADGNLLRGAAGDFKSETIFRFHSGTGDQLPDPLLVSAEASGQCPAYRNLAYAVFEDLQLADFGNRIPSLTFEIFERDVAVPLTDIAADCSGGVIGGQSDAAVTGFAAQGSDCRAALSGLLAAFPVQLAPDGAQLRLTNWTGSAGVVVLDDPAITDGRERIERPKYIRDAGNRAPALLSIRHYEPERDFQAGVQSSRRMGNARNELQVELAAAIDTSSARALADGQLLQRWRNLNGLSAAIARGEEPVRMGNRVQTGTGAANLRITEVEHQRGTTRFVAREWSVTPGVTITADPGRNRADPDLAIGETRIILADLPATSTQDPGKPVVVAAVAGTQAGWKRAALSWLDGERVIEIGQSKAPATLGHLLTPLPAHSAQIEDRNNRPIIRLLHEGMTLPPGTGSIASFDAPALWIEGEIIRYAAAEQIGPRDYRLSGLVRGGGATSHPAGARAFLLEEASLTPIDGVPLPAGSQLEVEALGSGDSAPVSDVIAVTGQAITPLSPVHGIWGETASGDRRIEWKRRDRLAYGWADAADIPNSEGTDDFAVDLLHGGDVIASWQAREPSLLISAADWAALSLPPGAALTFQIRQQGRFAISAPLAIDATS